MAEIRTRDEAITSVDRALQVWADFIQRVLTQAANVVNAARQESERTLRERANAVTALQQLVSATNDERRRRHLESELFHARASFEKARRATVRIADTADGVATLVRSHATDSAARVPAARAQLAAMLRGIEAYRGGATVVAGGIPPRESVRAGTSTSRDPLARLGLADVDVAAVDLEDTPIVGEFGRGGASRSDYRWAVQTWTDTVGPGVAKGMTRADFAERDTQRGSPPLRRAADVYDMFVGTERIRADRRSDGSLNIVNGRHRLQIARELGIKTLPGQVSL